jgi:putative ubiquitin-RnfH superfamily antitoxin RatB of RatAB toxin-antitoxin module
MTAETTNVPSDDITVSVAYVGTEKQGWQSVTVPDGASVQDVIVRSGVLARFPEIDLERQKVGIFGKLVKLDSTVRENDRVEIYRAITCDPATVPRRDQDDAGSSDESS